MEEAAVLPPPMFKNMSERRIKMRQVKCRNCGTFINRGSAISVQNGKAKLFYCNENCRQQAEEKKVAAQKEQAGKDAIYNEICSIFFNEAITIHIIDFVEIIHLLYSQEAWRYQVMASSMPR